MILLNSGAIDCNRWLAALTQFSLWGGFAWHFCTALSLYLSISNPFQRPDQYVGIFHVITWTFAIGLAAVVAFAEREDEDGCTVNVWGYRCDYQLCWVNKIDDQWNWYNWALMWFWLGIIMACSLSVLCYARRKLQIGSVKQTLASRSKKLKTIRLLVYAFTLYTVLVGMCWIIIYAEESWENFPDLDPNNLGIVEQLFATVWGTQGIIDVSIWIYTQRVELARIWSAMLARNPQHLQSSFTNL